MYRILGKVFSHFPALEMSCLEMTAADHLIETSFWGRTVLEELRLLWEQKMAESGAFSTQADVEAE